MRTRPVARSTSTSTACAANVYDAEKFGVLLEPGGSAAPATGTRDRPMPRPADGIAHGAQAVVEARRREARTAPRHRAGRVRVADAHLEGIHAELLRQLVHGALERERRLRAAVAAELAAGRERGVDEARVPGDAVGHVDGAERLHADVHDRRTEVVVRAVV